MINCTKPSSISYFIALNNNLITETFGGLLNSVKSSGHPLRYLKCSNKLEDNSTSPLFNQLIFILRISPSYLNEPLTVELDTSLLQKRAKMLAFQIHVLLSVLRRNDGINIVNCHVDSMRVSGIASLRTNHRSNRSSWSTIDATIARARCVSI